jgi:hypothetical protein
VVNVEHQLGGKGVVVAPQDPSDARMHEAVFVARCVDGHDPRKAEIPFEVAVDERGRSSARCPVDVDRDVQSGAGREAVEGSRDIGNRTRWRPGRSVVSA